MSNILIIKHGSLGDIVQISGVLKDIREAYRNNEKIFVLTTAPYVEVLSKCPFIDRILIDRRMPRWNLFYLIKLKNMIKKFEFSYAMICKILHVHHSIENICLTYQTGVAQKLK